MNYPHAEVRKGCLGLCQNKTLAWGVSCLPLLGMRISRACVIRPVAVGRDFLPELDVTMGLANETVTSGAFKGEREGCLSSSPPKTRLKGPEGLSG